MRVSIHHLPRLIYLYGAFWRFLAPVGLKFKSYRFLTIYDLESHQLPCAAIKLVIQVLCSLTPRPCYEGHGQEHSTLKKVRMHASGIPATMCAAGMV